MYKLLPTHSKLFILKNRQQCLESQRRYRQHRQQVKLKALQQAISERMAMSHQNQNKISANILFKIESSKKQPKAARNDGLCPLQLVLSGEQEGLQKRSARHQVSDEDREAMVKSGVYSETCFTDVNQHVEKSVVDYFGVFQNGNQVISDISFIGSLRAFNVPLIMDSWASSTTDFLELPKPQALLEDSQDLE